MDHTGEESVPRGVSLFEAHLNQPSRVALLQRRDGYDSDHLEVGAELPAGYEPPLRVLAELLGRHAPFSILQRGGDRAAGPHRAAAAVRADGADHRPGPGGRLAVRGRRGHGRGRCCAARTAPRSTSARADGTRARRDVAADRRAAQRDRARGRRRARLRGRPPPAASRCWPRGPELVDALQDAMAARLRTQAVAARALRRGVRSARFRRRLLEERQARRRRRGARGSARRRSRTGVGSSSGCGSATPYSRRERRPPRPARRT